MTWIDAPVERCFQLALSIDLLVAAAKRSKEKAVAGVTTGLIGEGQTVMWSGHHFGRRFTHTSRIVGWRAPAYFRDVMIKGAFRYFEHDHHFATMDDGTRMRDEVRFSAPLGPLGRLAEKTFLRRHLLTFLAERNAMIKRVAESEEWRKYVEEMPVKDSVALTGERVVGRWDESALLRS